MARIPMGQFQTANVVPTAERTRVITLDADNRGQQALASAVGGIAERQIDQQNQEARALARVKASNQLLDRESQISTITNDLGEKLRLGQLKPDDASAAYEQAVGALDPMTPEGLDEAETENFGLSLRKMKMQGSQFLDGKVGEARIAGAQADLSARGDMLLKSASLPGADPDMIARRFDQEDIDIAGRMAYGLKWGAFKQDIKDGIYTTSANQQVIDAGNDLGKLQNLQTQLTAEDGYFTTRLDPDKRNQLLNSVTGRISQVEQRNQQMAIRREINAERLLQEMAKQAALGMPPTVADQQRWQAGLAGTSLAGEYAARVEQMNQVQHVLQLPDVAQEQYLTQLKASMQQNGANAAQVANLNLLESAVAERRKLRETDPVSFSAITEGGSIEPITINAQTVGTPEGQQQLLAQLGERFLRSSGVRRQFGESVSPSPWTPAERDMLATVSKHLDDKTKLSFFGVIAAASGSREEYAAGIKPFAGDDLLVDTAGRAAFQGYKLPDGSSLAQTILDGRKILSDTSKPMPDDNLFKQSFDKAVGFAMPTGSQQRDRAYQSYRAAYAAISERKSKSFNGVSLDTEISNQALQAVTGGVTEWAGTKIIKPYGMSDADFLTSVGAQIDAAAERTGIPASSLKRMPLMAAPRNPGYYLLMNDGEAQKDPKTQQDLLVKP